MSASGRAALLLVEELLHHRLQFVDLTLLDFDDSLLLVGPGNKLLDTPNRVGDQTAHVELEQAIIALDDAVR